MKRVSLLVLISLAGLIFYACESKLKNSALDALSKAKIDIQMTEEDANVKKSKLSLEKAESLLMEAETLFTQKDYVNAKLIAEKASGEAKSLLAKAKEKKSQEKKKQKIKTKK